jgi:hypothetical protein
MRVSPGTETIHLRFALYGEGVTVDGEEEYGAV